MTRLALFFLFTFAACAQAAPGEALQRELDALIRSAPGEVGVLVEEPGGQRIYAHGAERPLVPASNMKLLTTAAVLYELGPTFAHRTRLLHMGEDLVIVGDGDPTLSSRFDPDPLLDELAAAVAAAGIKQVRDLVADDRAFDQERLHPDWDTSDAEHWYGAEVSALNLNDNCVDVTVAGGASAPAVSLRPDTGYVHVENKARVLNRSKGHVFSLLRVGEDKRTLRLTGRVWSKARPYTSSIPVADPALYFATVLRERLAARGVKVTGEIVRPQLGADLRGKQLWERVAPLPRTLQVTNQRSQNLYAECLLKTLGRRDGRGVLVRGGTWKNGAHQAREWAIAHGVKPDEVEVHDGSGLARSNRLSPRAIVTILRAALSGPQGGIYLESLSQAGVSGTLKRRLRNLPKGVLLRGKTGTLTGVHGLSGVLEAPGKRWLFSLITNGKGASRGVLDKIARVLAGHLAQ